MTVYEAVVSRLAMLGYTVTDNDETGLNFLIDKCEKDILADINQRVLPDGLFYVHVIWWPGNSSMIRKPPVVWTGWRALTSPPRPRASRRVMWPSPLLEPVMEPAALRPALMPCLQGSCARLRVRWRLFGG